MYVATLSTECMLNDCFMRVQVHVCTSCIVTTLYLFLFIYMQCHIIRRKKNTNIRTSTAFLWVIKLGLKFPYCIVNYRTLLVAIPNFP